MKRFILFLFFLVILNPLFAAEETTGFTPKTTWGGYGELHFNNQTKQGAATTRTLDFHRFVLFLSHSFNQHWSFKSEIELEHNYVKDGNGELELEQAFVKYSSGNFLSFQAGVILLPVGIYNLEHEPPLFNSVERPEYSKYIIPTTWFVNGITLIGNTDSLNIKLTITEGLDGSKFSQDQGIRGARQKGYKADAESLLYSLAVNFTGIRGLKTGASFTINNAIVAPGTKNRIILGEAHFQFSRGPLHLRGEAAFISYEKPELVNTTNPVETVFGWYLEIGYNISKLLFTKPAFKLVPWFRYSDNNTAFKTTTGGSSETAFKNSIWEAGLSFSPINSVIFKISYGLKINHKTGNKTKNLDLGAGYMF